MGLNHPALLETFFAAGSIGAAAVLVNPRLRQAGVEYILGDCGATTVVFGQDQREIAAGLEAELTGVRSLLGECGRRRTRGGVRAVPGLRFRGARGRTGGAGRPGPDHVHVRDHGPARGCHAHAPDNLFYQYVNTLIGQDLRQDEDHLAVAPLFRIAGLNMMTLPTFMLGGTIIIHRQFRTPDVVTPGASPWRTRTGTSTPRTA